MRYGVPYKGSKNSIAEWVYSHFPKRNNFYDLFAGGCAILQVALMRQEYKNYIANDIDDDGIKLFMQGIKGDFNHEERWISRSDFFKLKDTEPYIKYCWSFGNNGRDYLYSKEIEPYKKAWHFAIFENDFSYAKELNIDFEPIREVQNLYDKYLFSKRIIENIVKDYNLTKGNTLVRSQQLEALNRLESLERLQSLQSLQRLQSLERLQRLESLQSDYSFISIKSDSVIYCDIPYINTNAYGKKNVNSFDYERFYNWCSLQKEFLFISEYWMPEDRFICIDKIEKPVKLNSGVNLKAEEKLFIPKHQEEMYKEWKLSGGGFLFDV